MNQKMIPLDLRLKGMSVAAIHDNLVRTLGADAAIEIRVAEEVRSVTFDPKKERPSSKPASPLSMMHLISSC